MNSRELHSEGRRVVVMVADKGDEALAAIEEAGRRHGVRAAQVTAVGAFQEGELGYFDRERMTYQHIPFTEQVEVLSLLGDIAEQDGKPVAHLHVVLGRRDGSTLGGHLLRGQVWPTLEVIVTEVAPELAKRMDPQTGLALIDLQEP
jgi:uncharacterized protein